MFRIVADFQVQFVKTILRRKKLLLWQIHLLLQQLFFTV